MQFLPHVLLDGQMVEAFAAGNVKPARNELMRDEKARSATPIEIAVLAAVIDPAACREGNQPDALFHALDLYQESCRLCDEKPSRAIWLSDALLLGRLTIRDGIKEAVYGNSALLLLLRWLRH